jgi:hypothetical protein
MRSLVTLGLVAGTLFSTAAQASVETCAQTLLQSPGNVLYSTLQVTPAQTQRISWIRSSAYQQRAQLQAQLDQLGPVDIDEVGQEASLQQQIANVEAWAEQSVINLLSPWQQSQCTEQAMVVAPPPVIVTYPMPRPVYRPVVVRPAPRYPVVVRPMPPRYPVMVRPPVAPRPVVRPVVNAPASRGPIARGPAPTYHGRHR